MSKFVMINLDKPRRIKYSTNNFCELEKLLDMKVTELDDTSVGFVEMRTLLYVPLHSEDNSITLEDVGELIDEAGFKYCMEKIVEAINLATQTGEDRKNLEGVTQ